MKIAVLSTGRQDWGILRSTCALLRDDNRFSLSLWTGGMHESAAFGETAREIAADGFALDERLLWVDGREQSASDQAARALAEVGGAVARQQPDALLLAGDRLETASAALAATLATTPIAHLHGGEETEGAFDNALRHAITKMSHLHFVSNDEHARRVRQMGEDAASVHVVGAPGLDNLHRTDLPTRADLEAHFGVPLTPPVVIVTLHPTTLGGDQSREVQAMLAAMADVSATYVVTLPNSDPGSAAIRIALSEESKRRGYVCVDALGERRYWALMRVASAMLGNSSSAIVEASAIGLPAVNIGDRQRGRVRGQNVIDVTVDTDAITGALREALSDSARARARASSPFGDGHSASRIVDVLARWTPPRPPRKRFVDRRFVDRP